MLSNFLFLDTGRKFKIEYYISYCRCSTEQSPWSILQIVYCLILFKFHTKINMVRRRMKRYPLFLSQILLSGQLLLLVTARYAGIGSNHFVRDWKLLQIINE